jgi:signal transduction histidine kinase
MTRSLYTRLTLAFAGVLVLAVVAFVFTIGFVLSRRGGPEEFVSRSFELNVVTCQAALADGGRPALAEHLARMDEVYNCRHHLLDPDGTDLLDGTDRSDQLARAWQVPTGRPPMPPPILFGDDRMLVRPSPDGRVRLVIATHPMPGLSGAAWHLVWIPVGVVVTCLLLTYQVVRPLVKLRGIVERFGRGELSARARFTRTDEIGDLARAFDQTAERVETLLTAERRLLQDVSHELRSPLARLSFAVELNDAERVRKEVRRMADLVGELIELTRAEGEPAAGAVEDVDLEAVVREVAADAAVEAEARGGRVEVTADGVRLSGRAALLHRPVENVVRNAVRYAPPGTSVRVALSKAGGVARVTVRDHGPGVPDELLESIFAPFVRVEADRGRDAGGGGVGLGLAIARRAVAVHGGTISAKNAGPGLEVRIELPVAIYKA